MILVSAIGRGRHAVRHFDAFDDTNKVVGVIEGIEVPHGVSAAPDGRSCISRTNRSTLDASIPRRGR